MAKKLYDLAVKTGEYTSKGKTKGKYENIGVVMQSDEGNSYILMKKTFNPAGVTSDKESVLVSMFEPKDKEEKQSQEADETDAIPF